MLATTKYLRMCLLTWKTAHFHHLSSLVGDCCGHGTVGAYLGLDRSGGEMRGGQRRPATVVEADGIQRLKERVDRCVVSLLPATGELSGKFFIPACPKTPNLSFLADVCYGLVLSPCDLADLKRI